MLIRASGALDWRKFFRDGLRVLVDGTEVRDIVEADDEAGFVVHYCRDAAGELIADQDRYRVERLEGTVVFSGTRRESDTDRLAKAQTRRDLRQLRNVRNFARSEGGAG